MMAGDDSRYVTVEVAVTVLVDPSDSELLDRLDESRGSLSIAGVVRAEVEANLESVSYVRRASVKPNERR